MSIQITTAWEGFCFEELQLLMIPLTDQLKQTDYVYMLIVIIST